MVSVVNYGAFVLGVVWLTNSAHCPSCPELQRLCSAVVFAAAGRMLATLIIFYYSFPQYDEPDESSLGPRGASQTLIDSLPLEPLSSSTSETSCAVCLSDFAQESMLRRLPCNHSFHASCVDQWLKQNKVCPLCIQDVEVLSQQHTTEEAC